jgi:hypothetical protein
VKPAGDLFVTDMAQACEGDTATHWAAAPLQNLSTKFEKVTLTGEVSPTHARSLSGERGTAIYPTLSRRRIPQIRNAIPTMPARIGNVRCPAIAPACR